MQRGTFARFAALLAAAALPLLVVACSADSPSEPQQTTPPPTNPGASAFNITVTVSPNTIPAGSTDPVTVSVQVRRADNGAAPPTGTTVVVSTSGGTVGGVGSSAVLELIGGNAQTTLLPPSSPGTVIVQARLEQSVGQAAVTIREAATFFISSVQPAVGSPDGGDTVNINGGGFEEPVRVLFGGAPAVVRSVTASRIQVTSPRSTSTVPVGSTRTVEVQVTINLNEDQQLTDTLANAFIYTRGGSTQEPQIFSITPASGPNEGNTRITINGEGFQSPVQVFFGSGSVAAFQGVEAAVENVTSNQIVVRSPPATAFGQNNQNSTVSVLVKNLNTGFGVVQSSAFQYGSSVIITAMGPGAGPYTGGTNVQLSGQGFDEPVTVSLGGRAQQVLSVTGTQIIFRTVGVPPACPTNGVIAATGVSVTNIESGASGTAPLTFNYQVPRPIITGVLPPGGTQNGNFTVTITGANNGFEPPTRVVIRRGANSFSATILSESTSTITVRAPEIPNNALVEVECNDNGDTTIGERYQNTAFDVVVTNLITGCTNTFEGGYLARPTDTSCRGDIPPPPPPP